MRTSSRILIAVLVRTLVLAPAALAQTASTGSPGGQKIVNSLYQAETPSPLTGIRPMSRGDIAAAKQSGEGWGNVYKDMKADGLVTTRNLGQTISGHSATTVAPHRPVTVTLGNGRTVTTGTYSGHSGTLAGGHGTTALASGEGGGHGGGQGGGHGGRGH